MEVIMYYTYNGNPEDDIDTNEEIYQSRSNHSINANPVPSVNNNINNEGYNKLPSMSPYSPGTNYPTMKPNPHMSQPIRRQMMDDMSYDYDDDYDDGYDAGYDDGYSDSFDDGYDDDPDSDPDPRRRRRRRRRRHRRRRRPMMHIPYRPWWMY